MELTLPIQLLFIGASFATSALTSVLGMSGGLTLLAIMSSFLPVATLVPLHGIVMASNNSSRIFFMWKHIQWKFMPVWILGALIGIAIATLVFVQISDNTLRLLLGFGLLFFNWLPKNLVSKLRLDSNISLGAVSVIGGFTTMFVGAGATLGNAAIQHIIKNKHKYIATTAAMAAFNNIPKVLTFIFVMDFSFKPYIYLLAGMFIAGFLGAKFGKSVLHNIPEKTFKYLIKVVITLLAFRLLYSAWAG